MPSWLTFPKPTGRNWRLPNDRRIPFQTESISTRVSCDRGAWAGRVRNRLVCGPETIFLFLSLRGLVLAGAVPGLFYCGHDPSTRRRPLGLSDAPFSRSGLHGFPADGGSVHPDFLWPASPIPVGGPCQTCRRTSPARAPCL